MKQAYTEFVEKHWPLAKLPPAADWAISKEEIVGCNLTGQVIPELQCCNAVEEKEATIVVECDDPEEEEKKTHHSQS